MISREELYRLVWSEPMTTAAVQFEVSGSYMARVCALLNVPRPERGYWAKLAVGKAPPQTPLPEARPGDQLNWSRNGQLPPSPPPRRPARISSSARVRVPKAQFHGLLHGAKGHFENSRREADDGYLKPYKNLLLDVTASKAGLNKALAFANDLFNACESLGHRVTLSPSNDQVRRGDVDIREVRSKRQHEHYRHHWSPYRPTVVYIESVAIGLAVVEMSESVLLRYVNGKYVRETDYVPPKRSLHAIDHTWTTTRDQPSNRLRLVAYSPYWGSGWTAEWQETTSKQLDPLIPSIVKSLEAAAVEIVAQVEKSERKAEVARQEQLAAEEKRRREEDRRKVAQSIIDSQEHLRQIIDQWAGIVAVENFLAGVETRAASLSTEDRDHVIGRLGLARQLLGAQDPMAHFLSWKGPHERYRRRYDEEDAQTEGN